MSLPVTVYLILAGVLFTLGALTVLLRRNAIIELMGVELMLNAVNLVLVTFSRVHGNLTGQVFAFFVMVVAAAEVVVGLSIVVSIFRTRRSTSVGMGEKADRHLRIVGEELVEHTKCGLTLRQDVRPIEGIVHFPELLNSDTGGEVELHRIGFALLTWISAEAHILIEVVRCRG